MRDESPANAGNVEALPVEESDFEEVFYLLYDSYKRKRGRTLDPDQVRVLVDAFNEIAVSNNLAIAEVQRLEGELAETNEKKEKVERRWLSAR